MKIKELIEQTRNELAAAESRFNNAADSRDIEVAVYKIRAAELELDRLYSLAKVGELN